MIVDCAVYDSCVRRQGQLSVEAAMDAVSASPDSFVWIGLCEPTAEEFATVAEEFQLHPLAVEDALHPRQRPKLELYGDTLFIVIKPARYVDRDEVVELSQVVMFVGQQFLVSVRHGPTDVLGGLRRHLEADPERLKWGPMGVLHAILDKVVDDYAVVLNGVDQDIDEVERDVFSGDRRNHAERLYKLKRELLEFRHAVEPLADPLQTLTYRRLDPEEPASDYFRDVHDHVLRIRDRIETFDSLLDSALSANLAQVSMQQNADMRKISAWVAILAVPTMIAGIYGMNFDHMPELGWQYGYPLAVGVMVVACTALYAAFRRRDWL